MIWIEDNKLNVRNEDRKAVTGGVQLLFVGVILILTHMQLITSDSTLLIAIVNCLVYFSVRITLTDSLTTEKQKREAFNFYLTVMLNCNIIILIFAIISIT